MGKKDETKEKPINKMTAKELKEVALQIPEISGVHAMNKEELLSVVKKARGIVEETKPKDSSVRDIKLKIRDLKTKRETALKENNAKMADVYRSRIVTLKKKTRRIAKAS